MKKKAYGYLALLLPALLFTLAQTAHAAADCAVCTGDNSDIALWAALLVLAGCGGVIFFLWSKKRKKNDK